MKTIVLNQEPFGEFRLDPLAQVNPDYLPFIVTFKFSQPLILTDIEKLVANDLEEFLLNECKLLLRKYLDGDKK